MAHPLRFGIAGIALMLCCPLMAQPRTSNPGTSRTAADVVTGAGRSTPSARSLRTSGTSAVWAGKAEPSGGPPRPVPEPVVLSLLGLGGLSLAYAAGRRRRAEGPTRGTRN